MTVPPEPTTGLEPSEVGWRRAGHALDLAMIGTAGVYLAWPAGRTTAMTLVLSTVLAAHAAVRLRRDGKAGLLTLPISRLPHQIRLLGPHRRRPLEAAADLIGMVALGFMLWA